LLNKSQLVQQYHNIRYYENITQRYYLHVNLMIYMYIFSTPIIIVRENVGLWNKAKKNVKSHFLDFQKKTL